MKTHSRFLKTAFAVFITVLSLCCTKKHVNNGGRLSTVHPFQQYFINNSKAVNLSVHTNSYPLEIGYMFRASDTGSIYEIGLMLPDTGWSYTMTLWDSATQAILLQKVVKCSTATVFSYLDLNATNESVEIMKDHAYVISVNLLPVGVAGAAPSDYYDARRADQQAIFPITESYITFTNQYNRITNSPAFPNNLIVYQDLINGLIDIGFSHISY